MSTNEAPTPAGAGHPGSPTEVFWAFLVLGLTSFGGPVAHLGYFRDAFVVRRRWLSDAAYSELVALCHFLPGPASSQVGMALGLRRAGYAGMAAAWFAFTLPSAVVMVAFAAGIQTLGADPQAGWLLGLKAAAVAVVAHALMGMAHNLAVGKRRATIAVAALVVVVLMGSVLSQVIAILLGALLGLVWLTTAQSSSEASDESAGPVVRRRTGLACLSLFAVLLVALPVAAMVVSHPALGLADSFYRAGSLVFGGGHVVLPLLEAEVVSAGPVDQESFLAGYGAAQAVPGPLFTFAAYLGALVPVAGSSLLGAAIAVVAIFVPAGLLLVGVWPFWERLRALPRAHGAVAGAGAAVVGILAAALYDPVFLQGIVSAQTMAVAAVSFVALAVWRLPAWSVVPGASLVGVLLL